MTDTTPIRNKQIRVAWNVIGRKNSSGKPIMAGKWHPDTPAFRKDLRIIVESGIEAYGVGSHWIEERKSPA